MNGTRPSSLTPVAPGAEGNGGSSMSQQSPNAITPAENLARDRTSMASFRTQLALDRTTLAWVRTTLTMASFGFGMVAFFRSIAGTIAECGEPPVAPGGDPHGHGADPPGDRRDGARGFVSLVHAAKAPAWRIPGLESVALEYHGGDALRRHRSRRDSGHSSCDDGRHSFSTECLSGTTRRGFRQCEAAKSTAVFHQRGGILDMKIGTIQSLACVGLGTMLGFVAATRDFSPSSRADVATPAAGRPQRRPERPARASTSPPAVRRGWPGTCCWRRPARRRPRPRPRRPRPGRSRTSSSSWATTSAGSTSAPTTGA